MREHVSRCREPFCVLHVTRHFLSGLGRCTGHPSILHPGTVPLRLLREARCCACLECPPRAACTLSSGLQAPQGALVFRTRTERSGSRCAISAIHIQNSSESERMPTLSGTTCGHLVAQLGCEHHLISSTDLHWHRAGVPDQRGDSALLLWVYLLLNILLFGCTGS